MERARRVGQHLTGAVWIGVTERGKSRMLPEASLNELDRVQWDLQHPYARRSPPAMAVPLARRTATLQKGSALRGSQPVLYASLDLLDIQSA